MCGEPRPRCSARSESDSDMNSGLTGDARLHGLAVKEMLIQRGCAMVHPVFAAAAVAAMNRYDDALARFSRAELEAEVMMGADGTPTMHVDAFVEEAIIDEVIRQGVNLLSEEAGFIDRRSSLTLVVDPIDGSANAAAGIPLACFSAALVDDGKFIEAATVWLATGSVWAGSADGSRSSAVWSTTGCVDHAKAAVSLLRPHDRNFEAWRRVSNVSARIRILSCSTLEAMLVLQGSSDAFVDAGSDTHRLVDLAAALVLLPTVGGVVIDAFGRDIEFDTNLKRRWSGVVAATPELAEALAEAVSLHL